MRAAETNRISLLADWITLLVMQPLKQVPKLIHVWETSVLSRGYVSAWVHVTSRAHVSHHLITHYHTHKSWLWCFISAPDQGLVPYIYSVDRNVRGASLCTHLN